MNRAGRGGAGRVWTACGASVVGSEHRRRGLGCDDAYSYGIFGDFLVAAVADGAGSVTGTSAWGAYIACRGVLKDAMNPEFVDRFRSGSTAEAMQLMRSLFVGALQRVHRQAAAMGLDSAWLSTTLCVAMADSNLAAFAQVGDGVIATERGEVIKTSLTQRKDSYANITSFLQSERALDDSLRIICQSEVTAFALSTDGMSYKITDVATGAAYQPFFRGSWQHLRAGARSEQLRQMLGSIKDDQTGDDKTLVLAALQETAAPAGAEIIRWEHSGSPSGPDAPVGSGGTARLATRVAAASEPRSRLSWWGGWLR